MTRAVAKDDQSMYNSLKEVATLFDRAQQQVFKLMAGVSLLNFPIPPYPTDDCRTPCRNSSALKNTSRWLAISKTRSG
jgi:hypothetical protein